MPIYTVNGKTYDISPQEVDGFLATAQQEGLEVSEVAEDFQKATAEETAPVVAETPVDTELQSANGSSELQGNQQGPSQFAEDQRKPIGFLPSYEEKNNIKVEPTNAVEVFKNTKDQLKDITLSDFSNPRNLLAKAAINDEFVTSFSQNVFDLEKDKIENFKGELSKKYDLSKSEGVNDANKELNTFTTNLLKSAMDSSDGYKQRLNTYTDALVEKQIELINSAELKAEKENEAQVKALADYTFRSVPFLPDSVKKGGLKLMYTVPQAIDLGMPVTGALSKLDDAASLGKILERIESQGGTPSKEGGVFVTNIAGGSDKYESNEAAIEDYKNKIQEKYSEGLGKIVESQQYQEMIDKFGPPPEVWDEDGLTSEDFGELFGTQAGQMVMSIVPPLIYAQEAGGMLSEVLEGKGKEKLGEKWDSMSQEEKNKEYEDIVRNGEIDYTKLELAGGISASVDVLSNLFGASKIAKGVGGSVARNLVKRNFKGAIKASKGNLKEVLKAQISEVPTEMFQETITGTTVGSELGTIGITGQELKEAGAQAFVTSGPLVAAGRGTKGTIRQARKLAGLEFKSKKEITNQIKQETDAVEVLYENGSIDKAQRDEQLTAIYEAESIARESKYRNFETEAKEEMVDLEIQKKVLANKNENLKTQYNSDNVFSAGQVAVNEEKIEKLEAKKLNVLNKQVVLNMGNKFRDYINNNSEKFNGFTYSSFKTSDEAKDFLSRKGVDLNIENVQGLLNGDNYAVTLDEQKIIVDVKENLNLGKAGVGGNAVHHEGIHAILNSSDDATVESIVGGIKQFAKESGNKGLQDIVELSGLRVSNDYSDAMSREANEEFLASVSDFMRAKEVESGDVQVTTALSKIGNRIAEALSIGNPESLDFSGLENGSETIAFLRKYNSFNGNPISNIKLPAPKKGSTEIEVDEKATNKASPSRIVENVTFEEGSINQEFQKYTYDGKKNNAPDSFHAQAAYAYEPLAQAVVERISKVGFGISKEQDQFVMDYFSNKENKEAFVSDLVFGPDNNKASSLVGIAKRYNPAIGSFGGHAKTYLALQAIRVFEERASKQATQGAQTIDAPESREIAADEQEIDISKPVLERLNIADNISEDIEKLGEMSIIQAEKAISNKDISDLKKLNLRNKTFGDIFAKRLFGDIKNVLGKNTKTKSDFSDFLNNNYEALSDVALNYVDFQKGSGPASLWSLDNPPSKKEFTEYYEAEGEKTSTKSDRKKSLNNAIARAIANDARIKLTENNPSLNEGFVKATGITLASKVPYDLSLDESLKMISMLDKQDVNIDGVKISSLKTEDEVKAYFDYQEKSVWPLLPKKFLAWSEAPTQNQYLSKSGKELLAGESNSFSKKQRIKLREFAKTEFARRINKFKNFGPEILIDGKPVTDYKNKAYNTIQAPLERIAKGNGTLKDNETITSFNKRNKAIGKEIYTRFNKAVKDDKENAIGIAGFLQLAGNNTEHFNRALAEVVAISINPKGGVKRKYEWEHAMQQAHVSRLLLEGMLDDNRDFEVEFDAIMSNYKLIGLDYALNDLLKEGGFEKSMTGKLGGKWDVLKGTWLSRYFNDIIAELGGIDPAGLMHVSGVTLDKYYGIDTNGNSTKAMSSKVISEPNTPGDFNEASTAYKAIFMVGSPGGGKTNVGRGLKLGRKGYKVVNQDIALEALKTAAGLPESESNYNKEQRSLRSKLGSQAVKAGKDKFQQYKNEGKGFLVDGTGASYNATTKKINELKEAGYDVFLVAAMTPKKVAIERNKARKERSLPTFVVSKSYDQVVESLAKYKQDYGEKVFELDTTTIGFGEALPQEFLDKVYNGITQTKVTKGTLDKVAESKVMASKTLSDDFNQMFERVKGVKAEARYSEDRATKLAANKGKFKFFVPYSAEDFVGLIYPTLGKGKEGDKNMQWYKENLLDPFARGISNFESSKQSSMEEWRELKKSIKGTPVDLGKQATRGFSNEEAVRVYLWNERGVVPESLSKKDTDALVKHVEANSGLLTFAENVVGITEGVEYPAPQGDWLAGTLTTDLVNFVNTAKRADFLQEWQDNADAVYSKDNLNKLKAIYGKDYVDALENILYRMKTGRNRPSGTSKIEAQFMNWVNDSVATVMFLNTRSALLQTISSINFMNWSDNNPLKAAKAFANQPQFWKDFASLMNSDFLKQRRGGLKNDVNADELAREAAANTNKAKAAFAALLKAGFAPTQIADSFAISIGGASFYRNRVNTYIKQGLDQKQAEEKAMLDFKETAEESQQSSRPDKVSMEQASGLGRVILAFANTPAQYTRLTKKAALDLINGRGDWKTNASKILYYGAVQNIIFTTLQQALFALSFDDEKDEEEAMTKVANGIVDTLLRGSGVYGAGVATMKNMILEAIRQYKSKRTDYTKAALKLTTLSPPVDTKIRKLMSAGRAFTYKQSKKDMRELGIDVDNPAALAVGQIASALGNVPLDRAVLKLQNLKAASNQERETWEQIFLAMGYSEWQLGIDDDKSKKTRPKVFNTYRSGSKIPSRSEKPTSGSGKIPSPPTKRLERGVAGKAHNNGTIEVDPNLTPVEREKTIAHEKKHVEDMKAGKLNYDDNYVYWNGKKYERKNGKIKYNGKWYEEGHKSLPWEKRAYDAEPTTKEIKKRKKLY